MHETRLPIATILPLMSTLAAINPMSHQHSRGAWCSGITSASHAEGPGFHPQRAMLLSSIDATVIHAAG